MGSASREHHGVPDLLATTITDNKSVVSDTANLWLNDFEITGITRTLGKPVNLGGLHRRLSRQCFFIKARRFDGTH